MWGLIVFLVVCSSFQHAYRPSKSVIRRVVIHAASSAPGLYLSQLVAKKKVEVEGLLRRHQDPSDPLVMRMGYMASEGRFEVTRCLRRAGAGPQGLHTMSVLVDLKRRSPTVPARRHVVDFASAGKFAGLLAEAGADAFLVSTESSEYGGFPADLKDCVASMHRLRPKDPPACIAKDIFLHPIQIAQAVEAGAAGVLLVAAVLGADLEVLLNACTIMGVEAMVEVHTPNELEFALSRGATLFLVNMWDRMTGQLHPQQARGLAHMMPITSVAVAAGAVTLAQAAELCECGYEGVVLGRRIVDEPDISQFLDSVHGLRGAPRGMGFGMKGVLGM